MAQPAAAVEQDFPDNQALLPVAAVFFLPKNSALSALALDIVAQAAHQADAGEVRPPSVPGFARAFSR
jgi:hypothetical protein